MKKSDFSFKNPILVKMHHQINKEFDFENNQPIEISVDFDIKIDKDESNKSAIVELTVQVGKETEECPFYIEATEGALFTWSENVEDIVEPLLNENAPAVLLGYLRPIITMLTATSGLPPYNIPLINFSHSE